MPHKSFDASYKVADESAGIVEAVVSVFDNVDRAGERVRPGFFKASLERKLPKGVWMHDWTRPIAKTLEAAEIPAGDARLPESVRALGGLWVKGQINLEVQDGRDALSHLKFGTVDEFSFGYRVTKRAYDSESGVVDLLEGETFEWSPVLVGCNPATALMSAKDGRPLDADDVLQRYADLYDLLMGKSLDDVQRAQLKTHGDRLAELAKGPAPAADAFDPSGALALEIRSLELRASRLLTTP